jgi:hypothetical protein
VITATTVPAGRPVVITYNGSPSAPINSGSYPVVATINDPNYAGSASGTLVVSKGTATVTLSSLAQVYDGTAKAITATTVPAGRPIAFTYNGSASAPINSGSYSVVGTVNDPNYSGSASGTLVISKATATVTLGNLAQVYDGTAKSATVTTVPVNRPVTVTYNGSTTAPVNAGSYSVVATVNDPNYTGSATGTLVISQPGGNVVLGNLAQTYDGTAKAATATTTPPNLAVSFTYNGSATPPVNAGSYAVVATITNPSYTGTASGTLVISKAAATVTLGNLAQAYDGTARLVTASTVPAGRPVTFTYNGSATAPVNTGSYSVVATVNDPNYTGTANGTLVVSKGTATILLGNLAQTYDGSQKIPSVVTLPAGLSVSMSYNGIGAKPRNVGSYTVVATVSDSNYTGTATDTLVISKPAATVTLGNLTKTYTGTASAATATTVPAGLSVSFTYNGSTTVPVNAGTYTVVGTVNDNSYGGTATGTMVISKAIATMTLSNLARTYDGAAKAATATTTPAGLPVTITYDGSSTAPVNAASYAVLAIVNDTNYTSTASGTLNISKAAASVTLGNLTQTFDGTAKAVTATTAPAGLAVTLSYNGSSTAPSAAGSYAVTATVSDANYTGSANGTLLILQTGATLSLTNLAYTYDGTGKAASAITVPSDLPVSFTYNGSATLPINAGSYTVVATVTDPGHAGTVTGTMVISKATANVNLGNLAQTYNGTARSVSATTTPEGLAVTFTYNGSGSAPVDSGSYPVSAIVSDPNYIGSASGTLVVAKASASIQLGNLAQTYDGTAKAVSVQTTPANVAVSVTYNGQVTAPSAVGSYAVVATVIDINYTGTASGTLALTSTGETFSDWTTRRFTPAEIAAGAADDNADPDRDGMSNLAEYALGTDPHGTTPPPAISLGPDGLTLSFTRPKGLPDVEYVAESSDDMVTWTPIEMEIISDGTTQTLCACDPLTSGNRGMRLIRLSFTRSNGVSRPQ